MKRVVVAALAAALLVGGAGGLPSTTAEASPATVIYAGSEEKATGEWRWEQCRFARYDGEPGFSTDEVRLTLTCARRRWPGNLDLGFRIVGCESGFDATAQNSRSSAGGVWQVIDSTWASWKTRFAGLIARWRLSTAKLNGRVNSILGWLVFRGTTSPWNASRSCWAT